MGFGRLAITFVSLALAACATAATPWRVSLPDQDSGRCLRLFSDMDAAAAKAGVADAQWARIPNFPYLRVSRFLASYRNDAREAQFPDWVAQLAALDADGRAVELANLGRHDSNDIDRCRALLVKTDLRTPRSRQSLRAAARVADDYVYWQRLVGAYPLSAIPISLGAYKWRQQAIDDINGSADVLPVKGHLTAYAPSAAPPSDVRDLSHDSLGIPVLSPAQQQALLAAHAPVIVVDEVDDKDRIGAVTLSASGAPAINDSLAVAYTLVSHTRYQGKVLLQLVYVFWFRERPKTSALDLLGGKIDGLVWRITLDDNGKPILYDSMHPCGCYHIFFPVANLSRRHYGTKAPA